MAQSSSAAASTSTSTAPKSGHDVFINHRGLDVKKNFASHLYRRLQSYGLRVFLDQPELQRGDYFAAQIEEAIRYASVHVAIFSSGYAESTWCLRELVLMLQSDSPVIPVFYKVKPEALRWTLGKGGDAKALEGLEKKTSTDPQTGEEKLRYGRALEELGKKKSIDPQTGEEKLRYDPSLIQNWRNALSKAAEISGFELEECKGDEGELVDNVVEEVLKKVKKPDLHVAKYPTGLDAKVTHFEETVIYPPQGEPQIVGIVGLGGVGKTTLAKELFNRKSSGYSRCCFLADVRDNADKGTLLVLQIELLKKLGWDKPVDNVDEAKTILKRRISSPNILVILDDVDKMDQVDELLPDKKVLHSNSLILITSRFKDVLRDSGVKEKSIYKLTGLSLEHSLELFCLYSFNHVHPLPGFKSLVWKFIEACGGLPLSLKVFGAHLNGKDRSYWKVQLDKLQRILPEEIKQRLQISYDALDMEDRQIFLDIACFFIGEDRDRVIRIYAGSGGNSLWGFRNLENKCLVEVNSANKIRMHDHLRDMGREIADASLPRRVWRSTETIDDLLQQSSVINEVRGIRMAGDSSAMPWYQGNGEPFRNCVMELCNMLCSTLYPFHGTGSICMRNLQLLDTEDILVEHILTKVQFPNLVWLRWNNCPNSFLPSSISLKNLRVLQVQGSTLKTLWKKESQAPLQLRELEIKAFLSSIPKSIGKLTQLKRIVICPYNDEGKVTVTQLPEEFCFLQSLKALELEGFSEMESLPERFGELTNLRQISLRRCSALKRLPESLGNLANLHQINFSECSVLERLPDSFCKLIKLQHLDLRRCTNLTMSLRELFLGDTNIKELPLKKDEVKGERETSSDRRVSSIDHCILPRLEYLDLSGTGISEVSFAEGVCFNLQTLIMQSCNSVVEVGTLPNTLTWLVLYNCPSLRKMDNIYGLAKLEMLNITGCGELEELPCMETLVSLRQLLASGCVKLKGIRGLGQLTKLSSLTVNQCSELKELEGIQHCKSLRRLLVRHCPKLQWDAKQLRRLRPRKGLDFQYDH